MASNNTVADVVDTFDDVNQLQLWARIHDVSDNDHVQTRIRKLQDRDTILEFTDIDLLKQWALKNNKIFDPEVRNRMHQLEANIDVVGRKVCVYY